jgi:hypothetical protein|tara:strand:+ start:192 stop:425 length:234 start_codon:yes stop_codon:yes gene_type:complete
MLKLIIISLALAAGAAILWRICPPFKRWMGGDVPKNFGGTIYTYRFFDSHGAPHVRDFGRPLSETEAQDLEEIYKRH